MFFSAHGKLVIGGGEGTIDVTFESATLSKRSRTTYIARYWEGHVFGRWKECCLVYSKRVCMLVAAAVALPLDSSDGPKSFAFKFID